MSDETEIETPKPHIASSVWDAGSGLDTSWMTLGNCVGLDTELFFVGIRGESEAVEICEGCPVRKRCLDYALSAGCSDGVWGGLSAAERARMKKPKQARTHCAKGHSMTGDNVRTRSDGFQWCRTCNRRSARRHYLQNRQNLLGVS